MLHLQEMVKHGQQTRTVILSERLPNFITTSCQLEVTYHVEAKEDFYLIHLHVKGILPIQCQRCLDEFNFPYDNMTVVAVCRNDERAEQILELYECIVSENLQVSLEDILIDELHLYAPQFHPEINDCSSEINQILVGKNEFY
ncbi:metal-binding, possibly nucleic acid-binding protein [Legionella steigerwaltii]|uniref:Metal-binding protein n=1 Tax=Legionella steigerwaltii TaxID=460 RepID=A0A378L7S9_9GAMM|nr:metal-binding protein [Legionella steigerwaltii]KTD77576.1 metal-binding protein [Legionella steigerwaltii]STY22886.1 metal-binding, possibly nucleic acid-binding protein [Legionella steigerwaltii]